MKNILTEKCCTKCREIKPISDFGKRKDCNAYVSWCNKCMTRAAGDWKKRHPEIARTYKKIWRDRYPEKSRIESLRQYKRYKTAHPDKVKETQQKWSAANLDKEREHASKRRARVRGVVGGHFTAQEFKDLCATTGNKCLCCEITGVVLAADHVIPLGPPYSDEISNIQPLCKSCNSRKGRKTIDYRKDNKG